MAQSLTSITSVHNLKSASMCFVIELRMSYT